MTKSELHDSTTIELSSIVDRIHHYCAYQERCRQEVSRKLVQWKVTSVKIRKIMNDLQSEGYIDEERYARMFVRGKFHINKWGRVKIRYELRNRTIPEHLVSKAMEEIGDDDYNQTIRELVLRKMSEINSEKHLNIREKIITFVTGKGFEFDLVAKVLTELKI
jgi:regulatory protein